MTNNHDLLSTSPICQFQLFFLRGVKHPLSSQFQVGNLKKNLSGINKKGKKSPFKIITKPNVMVSVVSDRLMYFRPLNLLMKYVRTL